MEKIENKKYSSERALYNLKNTIILNCKFFGKEDGESVLKEAKNIVVDSSYFSLRYPLWHVNKFKLLSSFLNKKARAPIWYSKNGVIDKCEITSIKALRESKNIKISNSLINSNEFGWKCSDIIVDNSTITSEYLFLESKKLEIHNLTLNGKYSFQYVNNVLIENSNLKTKDAFWHSNNVTVKNSIIEGEYLAWYSKNLTLENCKIIGTQPFCYCDNLKLINCEMINTDLAFEYSTVDATIKGDVLSIKNPKAGIIKLDSVKEIIKDNSIYSSTCQIIQKKG